jgi:hypothetical protein
MELTCNQTAIECNNDKNNIFCLLCPMLDLQVL